MSGQPKNNESHPYENINNVIENELPDDEINDVTAGTILPILIRRGGEDTPPIVLF